MRAHSEDVGMSEIGCMALNILSRDHRESQLRIVQEGGVEAVVQAMRRHCMPLVQQYGCGALGNLTKSIGEHRLLVARDGGLEAGLCVRSRNLSLWTTPHASLSNRDLQGPLLHDVYRVSLFLRAQRALVSRCA